MLLAAGHERRSGSAERELAPVPGGIGDDQRASAVAKLDNRRRLGLAAEVPDRDRCSDGREGARRLHERPASQLVVDTWMRTQEGPRRLVWMA